MGLLIVVVPQDFAETFGFHFGEFQYERLRTEPSRQSARKIPVASTHDAFERGCDWSSVHTFFSDEPFIKILASPGCLPVSRKVKS